MFKFLMVIMIMWGIIITIALSKYSKEEIMETSKEMVKTLGNKDMDEKERIKKLKEMIKQQQNNEDIDDIQRMKNKFKNLND